MYIIDSNKDYYDHFSHIYGLDKKVVFDRRGSHRITDSNLVNCRECKYTDFQFILLETGLVQYLIEVKNIVISNVPKPSPNRSFNCYDAQLTSCEFEIVQKIEELRNVTGKPIAVRSVHNDWRSEWYCKLHPTPYSKYRITPDIEIDLPILASTSLTSVVAAEEIWRNISTYISSLNNDRDVTQAPDIEKVVNHGFDKKESFRRVN